MDKGRLEAFSDGVLAVAITLLVLDLHVSATDTTAAGGKVSLISQIRGDWASFAAYLVSFFVIGVIWVNHHALFALVARVDRALLFYNLLLLLWVTAIPFTTSTLASFEGHGGSDARWAVVLYGAASEGMGITFALLLRHMLSRGLTIRTVSKADARKAVRRYSLGAVIFPVVTLVGLASIGLMLVLYLGVVCYYVFEQTPILPVEVEAEADAGAGAGAEQEA